MAGIPLVYANRSRLSLDGGETGRYLMTCKSVSSLVVVRWSLPMCHPLLHIPIEIQIKTNSTLLEAA